MIRAAVRLNVPRELLGYDSFDLQRLDAEALEVRRVPGHQVRILRGAFEGRIVSLKHRHIDILKNLARSDAKYAIERFHQIITLAAAVLSAEMVSETERRTELFGFDQKSGAVSLPFPCLHGVSNTLFFFVVNAIGAAVFALRDGTAAEIFLRAKENVRAKWAPVNSVFLVQLRKKLGADFPEMRQPETDGSRLLVPVFAGELWLLGNLVE